MRRNTVRVLVVGAAMAVLALGFLLGPAALEIDYGRLFERAAWQLPERVVESLSLAPGAQVADIGAGDGYFTFYLADAVGPEGKVFALDVDAGITQRLEKVVEERSLTNVEILLAKTDDPLLPDGSIDLAFVCNVYHHIGDRVGYFDRLRSDLREGGRLAVVEMSDSVGFRLFTPPGHWTPLSELRDEMARAHYRLDQSFDFLPVQSFEIFVAESAPAEGPDR